MRNVFDQYQQPENRLSHALAISLNEDRSLLRHFLRWLRLKPVSATNRLCVVEQSLPGDPPESEEEAERRGLPDIVVHDGSTWCVLIESKVQASLSEDQLTRHERTLRRRGFQSITRVILTKADARTPRTVSLTWSRLYEWLGSISAGSKWPEYLRSYLRAAEVRLAREEYLTEGTLTMFDGFQFSAENPYTYGEAKRQLKLAMAELRKDLALKAIGMDPKAAGRSAITGRGRSSVWDFLSLADRPKRGLFTNYPHLTLGIHADHLDVAITIPHDVVRPVRQRLAQLGPEGLIRLNKRILGKSRRIRSRGAWMQAYALQRHYLSQRSSGITDASMSFKLETTIDGGHGAVKPQREWVTLFAELLGQKRANIQFGYVAYMPWGMKGLNRRDALDLVTESWCAMAPLLDVARGKQIKEG